MSLAMPDDSRYVSADVAAKRLGVSPATVRRRIKAGTLEGLIDKRPQGEVYLVLSDALPPDSSAEGTEGTPPVSPDTPEMAPDSTDLAGAIRAAVEPWERQVAEKDATIRAQAETIGHLTADASHLTRQVADLEDRLATAEAALRARRWRWWRILGL